MDEKEGLSKELFANFGRAYYYSECIHRGICNILALAPFNNFDYLTISRLEERLSTAYSFTFGQVLNELKDYFDQDLFQDLKIANERRKYLAHSFWFDNIHLMYSSDNIKKLLDELENTILLFAEINDKIDDVFDSIRNNFGIDDNIMEECLSEVREGKEMPPIIGQRKLKNSETVINVWKVTAGNSPAHIFELEDGTLWQLCDIGLGWTQFMKKEDSWKLDVEIQKHLLSRINPRPAHKINWNYSLMLQDGYSIHIKPGSKRKTYILKLIKTSSIK